jgi:uncharacterized membrane protein
MVGLGDLDGGTSSSQAMGVSSDGEVTVGFGNSGDLEASLWEDETIVGLGYLANPGQAADFQSLSYAVSFNGSVVVGQSDNYRLVFDPYVGDYVTARYAEPFRLEGGAMTALFDGLTQGDPNGQPWTFGIALAVNGDGSVVVGWGFGAFIWDDSRGMRDLQYALESEFGLDLTGWRLDRATGVSADGRVIVGYGRNPTGDQEAWVAVLSNPDPIPALGPIGIALLLAALGATAYWRLRESASAS